MSQGQLGTGAQLQLGLTLSARPLSAHSLHSLSLQVGFLPVARHTASGPRPACMALLCRLEKVLLCRGGLTVAEFGEQKAPL